MPRGSTPSHPLLGKRPVKNNHLQRRPSLSYESKQSILDMSFKYAAGLEYDYSVSRSCSQNQSSRCLDGYCRCGIISSTTIVEVDQEELFNEYLREWCPYQRAQLSDHFLFSLERFFSSLTKADFWFKIDGGYYGQEIGGIFLIDKIFARKGF